MTNNNFLSDEIFLALTAFGNPVFYIFLIVVLAAFNIPVVLPLLLALLFVEVLCVLIKLVYRKDRPSPQSREGLFNRVDANSFPSVHSARAALIAVIMTVYFQNPIITVTAIVFMIGTGYSRIYLKRHHAVDVLAGFLIGIMVALITVNIWM